MTPKPYIETPRLILRDWRDADIEPWCALCADPRVMQFFPKTSDHAESRASAAVMRSRVETEGYGWWAVEVKGGQPFAGVIALQKVPGEMPFAPAMEVGWRLAFDLWGRGLATEGALGALGFAFERLECDEIVAFTAAINLRSQRVMEKLGMQHDLAHDFKHPKLPAGHPLQNHVLYRLRRGAFLTTEHRGSRYTLL